MAINNLNAQGSNDKFFIAIGNTLFTDYFRMPGQNTLNYVTVNSTTNEVIGEYTAESLSGLSYYTFGAKFRYNLTDLSDDKSLSIHTTPALGISFSSMDNGSSYLGCFSMPLMIGFNTGNVSTYNTAKDKGFGIAVGVEYFSGGLIRLEDATDTEFYYNINGQDKSYVVTDDNKTSAFLVPVFEIAYRYWSKSNKARELTIQLGFGGKGDLETDPFFDSVVQTGSAKAPMHIRFMWSQYLNY